jgi:N6-L-threonylcarbamoyladenine synthase
MGSLLVGSSLLKSAGPRVSSCSVNHMHAHILAHFIDEEGLKSFPFSSFND